MYKRLALLILVAIGLVGCDIGQDGSANSFPHGSAPGG